jgi:hypothetical protein
MLETLNLHSGAMPPFRWIITLTFLISIIDGLGFILILTRASKLDSVSLIAFTISFEQIGRVISGALFPILEKKKVLRELIFSSWIIAAMSFFTVATNYFSTNLAYFLVTVMTFGFSISVLNLFLRTASTKIIADIFHKKVAIYSRVGICLGSLLAALLSSNLKFNFSILFMVILASMFCFRGINQILASTKVVEKSSNHIFSFLKFPHSNSFSILGFGLCQSLLITFTNTWIVKSRPEGFFSGPQGLSLLQIPLLLGTIAFIPIRKLSLLSNPSRQLNYLGIVIAIELMLAVLIKNATSTLAFTLYIVALGYLLSFSGYLVLKYVSNSIDDNEKVKVHGWSEIFTVFGAVSSALLVKSSNDLLFFVFGLTVFVVFCARNANLLNTFNKLNKNG